MTVNTDELVLAIDNGTSSVRALLFDMRGNLVAQNRVVIEPYFSEQPGWAEQDPHYFWKSLCQACQQLWAETDIPKKAVKGVALATQRSTVVNVDEQGEPLRPAIVWLDQRRTEGLPPVRGLWPSYMLCIVSCSETRRRTNQYPASTPPPVDTPSSLSVYRQATPSRISLPDPHGLFCPSTSARLLSYRHRPIVYLKVNVVPMLAFGV